MPRRGAVCQHRAPRTPSVRDVDNITVYSSAVAVQVRVMLVRR